MNTLDQFSIAVALSLLNVALYKGIFTYRWKTWTQKERGKDWTSEYIRLFFILYKEPVKALPWPQPTTGVNTLMPVNKAKLRNLAALLSASQKSNCVSIVPTLWRRPKPRSKASLFTFLKLKSYFFLIFSPLFNWLCPTHTKRALLWRCTTD